MISYYQSAECRSGEVRFIYCDKHSVSHENCFVRNIKLHRKLQFSDYFSSFDRVLQHETSLCNNTGEYRQQFVGFTQLTIFTFNSIFDILKNYIKRRIYCKILYDLKKKYIYLFHVVLLSLPQNKY